MKFLKNKIVFPTGIIKYSACIIVFAIAFVFITKDVILKDILSGAFDFETVLAILLVLFFGFGAFYLLPKYLKANFKQWILLQKRKNSQAAAKDIFSTIPQVTCIYANSDGWSFGGKAPYIENDETYVLADSKSLLAKEIFTLSCKNKLNLYYPVHIDSKDLMRFFKESFRYGFETFSFLTDNGSLHFSIKDILHIEREFIEDSEARFLHYYFILKQKLTRKRGIDKASLLWLETEQNELKTYAQKCMHALDNALFYILVDTAQKENVLLISEKASARMDADTIKNITGSMTVDAVRITNMAEARPLHYIFSTADRAENFIRNTQELSPEEDLLKIETAMQNLEKYTEEEQVDIRRNYAYVQRIIATQKAIKNSTLCIATGADLYPCGSQYILDIDHLIDSSEGDCIDFKELFSCIKNL